MLSSDETLNEDALAFHVARFPSLLNPLMFRPWRLHLRDYLRCEYDLGDKVRLHSGLGNQGTYVLVKGTTVPEERSNIAYFLHEGYNQKWRFRCGGLYRDNDVVNAYFEASPERQNLIVTAFFPLGFESWCQLVGNPAFGVRYVHRDVRTTSVCGVHACSDAVGMLLSGAVKLSSYASVAAVALVTQTSQLWSIGAECTFRRWRALCCLESNRVSRVQVSLDVTDQMRVALSLSPRFGVEVDLRH